MLKTAFAIAVTIGLSSPCMGEDLLEIYDLAVQSDPTLREFENTLYSTRELEPQARSLLLPNFAVSGNADYQSVNTRALGQTRTTPVGVNLQTGNLITESEFVSGRRNETFDSQGLTAAITQSVYNRADWLRLSQTRHTVAQADAQFRNAQIDLMVRTTEAYLNVLRAADQVGVQEAFVRANERQLEQSKQRFEVGLVAITDVNESQSVYDRSRANLISAENGLDNAWEALRRIVGPVSVPLQRLGADLPLQPPQPNDIEQWSQSALQNNYGIIAAAEASTAAKKQIDIERAGHLPTFDVQAGYDVARSGSDVGSDRDTAFISLQMNVPLYQGGAISSRTRQAGYDFRAAQDRLDQQRRLVLNLVKDAFRGILSSISDVEARQAAIVSARSALESTQAGLEVGTRTQVDVLNAQQGLFQAEFDYLSARYDYVLNGVRLYQATSQLTRDVLARVGNEWLNPNDLVQPPSN